MHEFLVGQVLQSEHKRQHEVAVTDHHHGFCVRLAVQGREQIMHAVFGHIGDRFARRRTPIQRISVLEHPVARVIGFEIVFRDGIDLTPGAFAQHACLLPFRLRQGHRGSRLTRAHVRRDEVTVEQRLLRDQPAADAICLLAAGGRKPPRTVGHGDVVLRIQRVVTLFTGTDNHVRFGFAMSNHIQIKGHSHIRLFLCFHPHPARVSVLPFIRPARIIIECFHRSRFERMPHAKPRRFHDWHTRSSRCRYVRFTASPTTRRGATTPARCRSARLSSL